MTGVGERVSGWVSGGAGVEMGMMSWMGGNVKWEGGLNGWGL